MVTFNNKWRSSSNNIYSNKNKKRNRLSKWSADPSNNIAIDSAEYEDKETARDTYVCNECATILEQSFTNNNDGSLQCPRCYASYLPESQTVRKNTAFDIPTDQEHQPEPAITPISGTDYN
jgi:DNA-directed RNA polymerase subunit RPC12/RpoP